MKKQYFLSVVALIALLTSCSKNDSENIEYVPFKESEKGLWGMISTDGEVLFSEEFKNRPTVVKDGMFMVKNKEGLWEIYTAEPKPKKVGGEYVSATLFNDGKAIVAERDKRVTIIDKNAKVIKEIDKIEGKEIGGLSSFDDGYAIFTVGKYLGVVDDDFKQVLKPEYVRIANLGNGNFIGIEKKYEKEIENDSIESIKFVILDKKGETRVELSGSKYCDIRESKGEYIPVATKHDGDKWWGIIDLNGETIVKPTEKLHKIGQIRGKNFTYNNGEGWGLMNIEGETLIRAKYESLVYDSDGILCASVKNDDGKVIYKFINEEDEQIGDDKFQEVYSYTSVDGNHAFVKVSDNQWSIVNKEGKQLEKLPDMVTVSINTGDYFVESDYVDISSILDELKITKDGIDGITFNTKPLEVIEMTKDYHYGDSEHKYNDPYWYDYKTNISYSPEHKNVSPSVSINYSGHLSRQTYRKEKEIDYVGYYYTYYHYNNIPTGYVWNEVSVESFSLTFNNYGRMKGKLRKTFSALCERFKNMGNVVKENNGAMVIKLTDTKSALVTLTSDEARVRWGLLGNPENIDIEKYKDAKEDVRGPEDDDLDYVDVDTVCVDTVAIDDY